MILSVKFTSVVVLAFSMTSSALCSDKEGLEAKEGFEADIGGYIGVAMSNYSFPNVTSSERLGTTFGGIVSRFQMGLTIGPWSKHLVSKGVPQIGGKEAEYNVLELDFKFHIYNRGPLRPYVKAGARYVNVSVRDAYHNPPGYLVSRGDASYDSSKLAIGGGMDVFVGRFIAMDVGFVFFSVDFTKSVSLSEKMFGPYGRFVQEPDVKKALSGASQSAILGIRIVYTRTRRIRP